MRDQLPTARFTVTGDRPVRIEVDGTLDAAASVGLRALLDCFVRDPEVVVDLRRCHVADDDARQAVDRAVRRIRDAGGRAPVLPPQRPPALASA